MVEIFEAFSGGNYGPDFQGVHPYIERGINLNMFFNFSEILFQYFDVEYLFTLFKFNIIHNSLQFSILVQAKTCAFT